ncbi:MAG: YraN family protein [Gammaproteobacteria bacterium]|nr:YraN family protein [Gammaproteobacteria bacterium]
MTTDKRTQGRQAEQLAKAYLQTRGLQFIQANYHCRMGELDLVMREADTLVFVEVRLRRSTAFGTAAESVTRSKQDKLWQAALHFTASRPDLASLAVRFDVVALSGMTVDDSCWIRNAFGAEH